MGEVEGFFLRLGLGFAAAVLVGVACSLLARKKGRDTVGWFFNGFLPGLVGCWMVVFAFPSHVLWVVCGAVLALALPVVLLMLRSLGPPGAEAGRKVRRPLRRFYLYLFLVVVLLLIVFGFIGYYCVPDQPGYSLIPPGNPAA